ncbi:MAG: hypothetical protein WCF30_11230 [Terracidiphilus sp.]
MQEETINPNPPPAEPGMAEPTPPQTGTTEATPSNGVAEPETQVARAASDSLEATATCPVKHDVVGNQGMPEETTDPISSPEEPGTAEPTSPQEDTFGASARNDEAGAEGQVSAAPSKAPESNLPPTVGGDVTHAAELEDGGCFEPFIPQVPLPPAPKPAPQPKPRSLMHMIDKAIFSEDYLPTPADTTPETEIPAPAADGSKDDAERAKSSETLPAPVQAPLPPPRVAAAVELHMWIKRALSAQTHLSEDAAELIGFWVITTWFQDALTVLPCLLLTGAAHEASRVLHVLRNLCCEARLLSGFRRSHICVLHWGCKTNLVSEPNLDKRTAGLLGNLTDKNFMVVERGSLISCAKSAAIYAGENPETPRIENSIHIHLAPTNAAPPAPPQWLQKMMERLPVHMDQYRDKNLSDVRRWTWVPSGLSSEPAAIAAPLGRCLTNAPELRRRLLALLRTEDQQRLSEMSNTTEAVVLEATWTLCRDGREHAYAREIAAAANHLLEARGESARLRPENVGHTLKGLGLRTRRLSQSGNGLKFDRAAIAQIQRLAAVYMVDVMEDSPAETENLHGSQATEDTQF